MTPVDLILLPICFRYIPFTDIDIHHLIAPDRNQACDLSRHLLVIVGMNPAPGRYRAVTQKLQAMDHNYPATTHRTYPPVDIRPFPNPSNQEKMARGLNLIGPFHGIPFVNL